MSRIVRAIEDTLGLDRWIGRKEAWMIRGWSAYFVAFALVNDWRWKVALYLYALICQIVAYRKRGLRMINGSNQPS